MKNFSSYVWQLVLVTLFFSAYNGTTKTNDDDAGSSTRTTTWQVGVALYSFNRYSFADALKMADSTGVKSVEGFSFHKMGKEFKDSTMSQLSMTGIKKMKQMLDDNDLVMGSLYAAGAKDVEGWKKFFNDARELGAKLLVCEPPKNQWDMLDSLAGLYGIKIAIHEHAKGKSAYWHPDSVLSALKGHPNFGACADLGHWARSGLDPVPCLKELSGHILDIHLKDIDSFNNVEANDVNVGTGVLDFPAIIKELKAQHYSGPINLECEHDFDDNVADIVQGFNYFNELTEKADK